MQDHPTRSDKAPHLGVSHRRTSTHQATSSHHAHPGKKEPCIRHFLFRSCRDESRCSFSHEAEALAPVHCPDHYHGTCPKGQACGLLHLDRIDSKSQLLDQFGKDSGADRPPTVTLRHVAHEAGELSNRPYQDAIHAEREMFAANALHDARLHVLPGQDAAELELATVAHLLRSNSSYGQSHGPKTTAHSSSKSVPLYQRRENRQATPPIPDDPGDEEKERVANAASFHARLLHLRQQIFDAGKHDLFHTLTRSNDHTMPKTVVLNIAMLQHMALQQLHYDLASYVAYMYRTSQFWMELKGFPPLTELVNKYTEAVRNLEYMKQCALRGYEEDAFLMKSSSSLERQVMETVGLIPDHVLPAGPLPHPRDHHAPKLRDMGRNEANSAAYQHKLLIRFGFAFTGGLFLIVPMLIMVNIDTFLATMSTIVAAILVFAAAVSWFTDLGPNELLATTAGYAAVLVVFGGSSFLDISGGAGSRS